MIVNVKGKEKKYDDRNLFKPFFFWNAKDQVASQVHLF